MKKTLLLLLALVLCLSLCACGHTHAYGEWTVVTKASCTTDGTQERVCECGEKEVQAIPGGHTYGEAKEVKAASCQEDGVKEKTCTACGSTVTETIAATGHSFTNATVFAPKTCTTCGMTEGEALAKVIEVGDTVEAEDHSFVVESIKFTGSLSEKRGYVTYTHSSDYALAIKLNFTNLSTDDFERWSSDRTEEITLQYKGKYIYEGEYWIPDDDIVPLASDSLYIVYEVPKSMGDDATSAIFASFTIDDEAYAIAVQKGEMEGEANTSEEVDASGEIAEGDDVTNNTSFSFKVSDLYYTDKPKYKTGNITYSYSSNGPCLVLKLDFTNLAAEALPDWGSDRISDIKLTFANKYDYEGKLWIPNDDIVPLGNGYVFLVFEIADNIETSTDALTMTFTVDNNTFTMNCR